MQKAQACDKPLIIDMLANAFDNNKSINYLVRPNSQRTKHIRQLCAYSFELCTLFGEVFLSDDRKACALVLLPEQKKVNFSSIRLDLGLVLRTIGLLKLPAAIKREAAIKKLHPQESLYHIWYIGVQPQDQGKGAGTRLLTALIQRARLLNRIPVLETSTQQNLPWYEKHGFEIYGALHFGFPLYCLKAPVGS